MILTEKCEIDFVIRAKEYMVRQCERLIATINGTIHPVPDYETSREIQIRCFWVEMEELVASLLEAGGEDLGFDTHFISVWHDRKPVAMVQRYTTGENEHRTMTEIWNVDFGGETAVRHRLTGPAQTLKLLLDEESDQVWFVSGKCVSDFRSILQADEQKILAYYNKCTINRKKELKNILRTLHYSGAIYVSDEFVQTFCNLPKTIED